MRPLLSPPLSAKTCRAETGRRTHADYLAGKGVFNISPQRIGKIAVWSCRFWAAYVVLCALSLPPQAPSSCKAARLTRTRPPRLPRPQADFPHPPVVPAPARVAQRAPPLDARARPRGRRGPGSGRGRAGAARRARHAGEEPQARLLGSGGLPPAHGPLVRLSFVALVLAGADVCSLAASSSRSIPGGILPNNVWVGVCGTIAGLAQLKGVWQATA